MTRSVLHIAGRTAIRCIVAWPFAVAAMAAGFLAADWLASRDYMLHPNSAPSFVPCEPGCDICEAILP